MIKLDTWEGQTLIQIYTQYKKKGLLQQNILLQYKVFPIATNHFVAKS